MLTPPLPALPRLQVRPGWLGYGTDLDTNVALAVRATCPACGCCRSLCDCTTAAETAASALRLLLPTLLWGIRPSTCCPCP